MHLLWSKRRPPRGETNRRVFEPTPTMRRVGIFGAAFWSQFLNHALFAGVAAANPVQRIATDTNTGATSVAGACVCEIELCPDTKQICRNFLRPWTVSKRSRYG